MRTPLRGLFGLFAVIVGLANPGIASADPPSPVAPTPPAAIDATSPPRRTCDAMLRVPRNREGFRHTSNWFLTDNQPALHRGRDAFVRVGDAQWATAKISYGMPGIGISDEDVDIYVLRDCRRWESLGTTRTAGGRSVVALPDGTTSNEEGLVSFRVPDRAMLGMGTHRFRFVVRADRSWVDAMIDVVPTGARFVVSDIDGTLTETEAAFFLESVGLHGDPTVHAGAPELLQSLAARGYQIFYLTGRPEWSVGATRAWLREHHFPAGVLRTRADLHTGLLARNVAGYKIRELSAVSRLFGRPPDFAFGNTSADVAAYAAAGVAPEHQFFYQYDGPHGSVRNDDYRELLVRFEALLHARLLALRDNPY